MAPKKQKAKKSPITKTPPPPPPPPRLRLTYRIRNQWLWSWTELPPTNPSYHITAARKLWLNTFTSAHAVTKSWLPPPSKTRCDAHHNHPPQLRHIATSPAGAFSNRYECNAPDPFDTEWKNKKKKKKSMEFTSTVKFQGSYYAMSAQGALAIMEVVDTRLTVTAVTESRAVPRSGWRFFKEYLFEMNGEIMLVFLIHRESLAVVDHIEVWKLGWVRVEMLRGKTLFLNTRCLWVDSEEFGCGDNRVYFTEGSEESWKVFNMNTCCISPVSSGWSWQSRC